MDYILRPVYSRPETLYHSLQFEILARKNQLSFSNNITTVFYIEYGTDIDVIKMVEEFTYPKQIIYRPQKYYAAKNIMDGLQNLGQLTDSFVCIIEDDVLIHPCFFRYIQKNIDLLQGQSTILLSWDTKERDYQHSILDLSVTQINPPWYASWGAILSKNVIELLFKEEITYANNGRNIYTQSNQIVGVDGYMSFYRLKKENWQIYAPYLSRVLHIGIQGESLISDVSFQSMTLEEKIQWYRIHLDQKDLWEHSLTIKKMWPNRSTDFLNSYHLFLNNEV